MRPIHLLVPFLASLSALPAQLAGTYTVNPTWPASSTNFATLFDATTALAAQGVAGAVEFLLYDDAGPFNEAAPFTTANTGGLWAPNTAVLTMTSWVGASPSNRITWKPAPGERPVFDATGRAMGVFWGGADYVTLQGIEIRNAPFDGVSLYAESTHGVAFDPTIDGCTVHDCGGTAVTVYGNSSYPVNTLVQNCTFWRCQLTNSGAFNGTGRFGYVCTRRSTNTRIVHNTFVADTLANGTICVIGAYPSGTTEQPYAEISNNVIVKSASAASPVIRINGVTGSTFLVPPVCDSNCFFDTSGGPFAQWGAGGTTVATTLFDWQTNALRDLASLAADPQFRDGANRDYHLAGNSPCIAGSTIAAGVAVDRDGQTRTVPEDLGADEFTAGTWAVLGTGCAGSGPAPQLGCDEPFLGNPSFGLYTDTGLPGSISVLFGALAPALPPLPFGNCTIYLDTSSAVGLAVGLAGATGVTSVAFTLPANPAFVNLQLDYQALVLDAAAPLGFVLSNGLDVVFSF
ncbi:MAG: right-handed parallel beta-helix repeat-containing protein [Planctomycetes bacterium]|nr:right-handed parallel beta-helix repeat-containing protein [Planctomycetota bacterium]